VRGNNKMRLIEVHNRPVYTLEFTWDELWCLFRCLRVAQDKLPDVPSEDWIMSEDPRRFAGKMADQLSVLINKKPDGGK
jgi:hypothetical protein